MADHIEITRKLKQALSETFMKAPLSITNNQHNMKTQQEINELADAYYDGMAEVMDRFDKINKVEETNKYIMARFGRLPEDDEGSELIVEYKTLEVQKRKINKKFFLILFAMLIITFTCIYAVAFDSQPATIICTITIIFGGVMYIFND